MLALIRDSIIEQACLFHPTLSASLETELQDFYIRSPS